MVGDKVGRLSVVISVSTSFSLSVMSTAESHVAEPVLKMQSIDVISVTSKSPVEKISVDNSSILSIYDQPSMSYDCRFMIQ